MGAVRSGMNQRLIDALREIARYRARSPAPYWWRKASMRQLESLGMVTRDPHHGTDSQPAWLLTEGGEAHVKRLEDGTP